MQHCEKLSQFERFQKAFHRFVFCPKLEVMIPQTILHGSIFNFSENDGHKEQRMSDAGLECPIEYSTRCAVGANVPAVKVSVMNGRRQAIAFQCYTQGFQFGHDFSYSLHFFSEISNSKNRELIEFLHPKLNKIR
jgi:hypothetical protein